MQYDEKVRRFCKEAADRNVERQMAYPNLIRRLAAAGAKMPPPLFLRPLQMLAYFTCSFAILWPLAMWVGGTLLGMLGLCLVEFQVSQAWLAVTAGGAIAFGIVMTRRFWLVQRRLGLPPWARYPEDASPGVTGRRP